GEKGEVGEAWFGGVRTRGMGLEEWGELEESEIVERVILESRHWLHDGDLYQGVEKFGGVGSPFVPYLDCCLEEGLSKTFSIKRRRRIEVERMMDNEDDVWFKY
ncbi:hypothetical protein Tco_0225711, partial [Tanacetum coccineum]